MIEKRYFLLTFRPVRSGMHASITPEEQSYVEQHFLYLSKLQDDGVLHFAGRSDDGSFGIAILEARSEESAQALFDGDPAVQGGIFEGGVRSYNLPLGSLGSER